MKDKLQLFALDIAKLGDDKILETLHILAFNSAHASHLGFHMIMDEDNNDDRYSFPVEIINIRKELGIKEIINASDFSEDEDIEEYDPEMPYKLLDNKNFPADEVIKFKCDCKNDVIVANINWPFILCKSCKRQILHRDLELVSGMWLFHPSN